MSDTCFCILFGSHQGERLAHTVIESLREFGGAQGRHPVWAFDIGRGPATRPLPDLRGVERFALEIDQNMVGFPLSSKVAACAQAENLAEGRFGSLVWLSLDSLIVNPPRLFELGETYDAAFRPVHHQNIGSAADEPLDAFWTEVYRTVGLSKVPYTVESYVDSISLRPYFNTHCFATRPSTGLCRAWWEHFQAMISDAHFQAGPCADELHKVFLHQSVLSTLVAKELPRERVRLLPPEYNYPLNLLSEMPAALRAESLSSLVNAVYEDEFPWSGIRVEEPMRSWLRSRLPA